MATRPGAHSAGLALLLVLLVAGCQSTGRLAEYDFAGGTLFPVYDLPNQPDILSGPYFVPDPDDPVRTLIRAGGAVVREVAVADARDRLDRAAASVDLPVRMGERLEGRVARYLRTELVANEADADYGMEVRVRRYGIDAERWDAAAHYFVDAQVILYDAGDGRTIWESKVTERERMAPAIFGGRRASVIRDVVTAGALASMSEEDVVLALEGLADFAADRISERLRRSLDKVR